MVEKCLESLKNLAGDVYTFNEYTTKCNCISFLADAMNVDILHTTAVYMVHWTSLSVQTIRELLFEWARFGSYTSDDTDKKYILPRFFPMSTEDAENVIL